jgi:hypothetical protein
MFFAAVKIQNPLFFAFLRLAQFYFSDYPLINVSFVQIHDTSYFHPYKTGIHQQKFFTKNI